MRAGRLRDRVALQSLTETQDSVGQKIKSYTTYATVYAEIRALKGKELEIQNQIQAETEYKITIRYNSSVTETDRISFDSTIYEIISIIPDVRKTYQEIMCKVMD